MHSNFGNTNQPPEPVGRMVRYPETMPIPKNSVRFTTLLAALAALPPLSIDTSLPAVPQIAEAMHSSSSTAALTLPIFMLGFSLAPVLYGPLSDRFGRRPILLSGCLLFALSGAACALAPSIAWMLCARFFQGSGAGVGNAMVFAIVRDLFEGAEARVRLSYVSVIMTVAPMIAPSIGARLLVFAGWRSIFVLLASFGFGLTLVVALFLEESAPLENRANFRIQTVLGHYRRALSTPTCIGYAIVNGLTFGVMFAYIAGSPLVMIEAFGVSPTVYAYLFASTAMGLMSGAFLSGRLNRRGVAPSRLLSFALGLAACTTTTLVVIASSRFASVGTFMPLLIATTFCNGIITPNAVQGAIHRFPQIAGILGALVSSLQMFCAAVSGTIVAALSSRGRSVVAMPEVMSVLAIASLSVYFGVVRRSERHAHEYARAGAVD